MNVSWCRSKWLHDVPHKSEQYRLCPISVFCISVFLYFCISVFLLHGAGAFVYVCVGGGVSLS